MARECFVVGDLRNAKQLLDGVESAALPVPSDSGIQSFRHQECGPAGPANLAHREIIYEVFELGSGETRLATVEGNTDLKVNEENPLRLEIDLASPLRLVLVASVAFHEPMFKPRWWCSFSYETSSLNTVHLAIGPGRIGTAFP